MSKQRPDPERLANELSGASAFFKRPASPSPGSEPVSPTPTPELASDTPESLQRSDVTTSPRHDVATSPITQTAGFNINRETASRDSLRLSIDEMKALDALRQSLKWDYDLTVSKNDICRVALHALLEEFAAKGEKSQALSRLKKKTNGR